MDDRACVAFLHWCLPRLGLRWPGYRKVRRLVGKRINRRLAALGLADPCAYRAFLTSTPAEWARLDVMCRIPISRFYRDRGAFDAIIRRLLPQLAAMASARGIAGIKCWSAGCASGEEPYTLSIGWRLCIGQDWPTLQLAVIATDADKTMIERAKAACYSRSSLKELPQLLLAIRNPALQLSRAGGRRFTGFAHLQALPPRPPAWAVQTYQQR